LLCGYQFSSLLLGPSVFKNLADTFPELCLQSFDIDGPPDCELVKSYLLVHSSSRFELLGRVHVEHVSQLVLILGREVRSNHVCVLFFEADFYFTSNFRAEVRCVILRRVGLLDYLAFFVHVLRFLLFALSLLCAQYLVLVVVLDLKLSAEDLSEPLKVKLVI
jgi:hypothetical protein